VDTSEADEILSNDTLSNSETERSVRPQETTPAVQQTDSFLQRPNSNYVLQIMAASNKTTLEEFRDLQPNRNSIELIAVKRNGQNWYVLLQGDYSDVRQARNAIQSLPEIQRKDGVWPRSVGEIKRSIEDN
jgi:DamX protein